MQITIDCMCGGSRQRLTAPAHPHILPSDAETDRRGSGLLFVSHLAIDPPEPQRLSELSCHEYDAGARFFCGVCGCHVFQKFTASDASASLAQTMGDTQLPTELFAVATGVIIESASEKERVPFGSAPVDDTGDGGLGPYLPVAEMKGRTHKPQIEAPETPNNPVPAACGCGNVKLLIQHPGYFSGMEVELPYSPYPDLLFPFKTTPKDKLDNPSDEKWYLRKRGKKLGYLAGTCACKSCRLSAGYEIQSWAFIPRLAIEISVASVSVANSKSTNLHAKNEAQDDKSYIPLDFGVLRQLPPLRNPLRSYESSRGVFREFCHVCGATVFWHSNVRPDLIDVSVGLLQAREGARAESLLEWWLERCSFAEDAGLDREGWVKDWAESLIRGLEEEMRR